jgi:glutamine amidotransferase
MKDEASKMKGEIAVIDYGMGNLRSVEKGIARTGVPVVVTSDPAEIAAARGVVLPGVGAFGACMENLRSRALVEPVREAVSSGKPFLGICLGLQLLFEESEEFGPVKGLGVFAGRVRRFAGSAFDGLKIPQMGWNRLRIRRPVDELEGIEEGSYVYFVHSYYVEPADSSLTVASTEYGIEFTAAIARDNVFACQFHPEKSQTTGLRILENFARRVAAA